MNNQRLTRVRIILRYQRGTEELKNDRQHNGQKKLEVQWAEPVLLTFHSALNLIQNLP